MDVDAFWALVESARSDVDGQVDDEALATRLTRVSPEEIVGFQVRFDRTCDALHRWDVQAAAYLIGGGCSDDAFTDFRAGVVGLGREWYERVLGSPDDLAGHPVVRRAAAEGDDEALFAESLAYAAGEAYAQVTGDEEAFHAALEALAEAAAGPGEAADLGEDLDLDDEDEMRRRLPRLAELFLGPGDDGPGVG
ncbi:MAG TPA: DUF4240 domain-containing protein [Pseudonocardia sp.]|nr:DUF4240 domain-containing protein [Pseudonocardia sp.]